MKSISMSSKLRSVVCQDYCHFRQDSSTSLNKPRPITYFHSFLFSFFFLLSFPSLFFFLTFFISVLFHTASALTIPLSVALFPHSMVPPWPWSVMVPPRLISSLEFLSISQNRFALSGIPCWCRRMESLDSLEKVWQFTFTLWTTAENSICIGSNESVLVGYVCPLGSWDRLSQ